MIKMPVHAATELDDEDDITYTGEIYDDNGNSICVADIDLVDEIVIRINLHGELVKSLREMVEIVGSNFCSNQEIKQKYRSAFNLINYLEKCK